MSEEYKKVEAFIDYILDEEDEEFNESLPFGGIVSDAPEEVRKAYEKYVEEKEKLKEKGIKS